MCRVLLEFCPEGDNKNLLHRLKHARKFTHCDTLTIIGGHSVYCAGWMEIRHPDKPQSYKCKLCTETINRLLHNPRVRKAAPVKRAGKGEDGQGGIQRGIKRLKMDKEGGHERVAEGKQAATQEGHGTLGQGDNMTGLYNSTGHPGAPSLDEEYGGPSNQNDARNFATARHVQAWNEMVQTMEVMYGPSEYTVEEGFAQFLEDLENMTDDESRDGGEDDLLEDDILEDADPEAETVPGGSPCTSPSPPGPESPPVNCPVL